MTDWCTRYGLPCEEAAEDCPLYEIELVVGGPTGCYYCAYKDKLGDHVVHVGDQVLGEVLQPEAAVGPDGYSTLQGGANPTRQQRDIEGSSYREPAQGRRVA